MRTTLASRTADSPKKSLRTRKLPERYTPVNGNRLVGDENFEIFDEDEIGLFPNGARYAEVFYGKEGQPKSVYFSPKSEFRDLGMYETKKYQKRLRQCERKNSRADRKMNPRRTPEEVKKIIIRLRSSAVN